MSSTLEAAISGIRDTEVQKSIKEIIREKLGEATQAITEQLNTLEEQHVISYEKILTDDPLRVRIDNILSEVDQVGPKPDAETLESRKKAAAERCQNKVPPGYIDSTKTDNAEGDALIWFEILDHAEKAARPLLFITSDVKPDWYRREDGRTLGPRTELRSEFATRSPHPYHQVRLASFLHLANEFLNAGVSGKTIDSVEALDEHRRLERWKAREQMRLRRFRRPSTQRALSVALSHFEPGSRQYKNIQGGLDILGGELEYNPIVVNRALTTLDRAAAELGQPLSTIDPAEMREHLRRRISQVSESMEPVEFLEFLEAYVEDTRENPEDI